MTHKMLNPHEIWSTERIMLFQGLRLIRSLLYKQVSPPKKLTADHINTLVLINGKLNQIIKLLKGETL